MIIPFYFEPRPTKYTVNHEICFRLEFVLIPPAIKPFTLLPSQLINDYRTQTHKANMLLNYLVNVWKPLFHINFPATQNLLQIYTTLTLYTEIVLCKVRIPTASDKVGILTLSRAIPELS